jgi:D-alanyl-D-alanine carboxypeptidase/D-alanyl-D-alanine-endopeptidase (penicillin-binding protein 4)
MSTPTASAAPCSAAAAIGQKSLGQFYGYVIDTATGKVLLDTRGSEATPSASVLKVLTVAAALDKLPADYRATTKVFSVPSAPGTIVLQGGGDHTLSRMTGDSFTTYSNAARLETLAAQVLATWALDTPVTKIILDQNFFSGASYTSAWKLSDRTNGYISHITGLQVDSDRANPDLTSKAYSGYRSTNPVNQTGKFFKEALQGLADDASLVVGRTPANAVLLTSVSSAPIGTWLQHAISVSDNTETEFIARHAAKAAGLAPRFESIEPLVVKTLAKLGVDSTGLVMKDGSGLAQANRVTPKLVAELLAKSAADTGPLSQLVSYLPVAGRSGTLATRFTGKNAMARTFVTGKSGYIPGLYSLAGIIKAKDGSKLSYAIFARSAGSKKVGYAARGALDTVATRFYQCGLGLTK